MSAELEKRVSKLEDRHEELQAQVLSLSTQFAEVKAITSRTEAYYHDMIPRIRGIESVISDLRIERTQCFYDCSSGMTKTNQQLIDLLQDTKKELREDINAILPIVKAVKFSAIFVLMTIVTFTLSIDFDKAFGFVTSFFGL